MMNSDKLNSHESRIDSVLLDTTNTFTIFDTDLDVTIGTPSRAPWVLDKVVISTVFRAIADNKDTMIKFSSTSRTSQDTTFVSLKYHFVGFYGDWNRLLSNSSLESFRAHLDIVSSFNFYLCVGTGLIFANTIFSLVAIIAFKNNVVILVVIVSSI